jgi:hypothetical protein
LQPTRSTFVFEEQRPKDVFGAEISTMQRTQGAVRAEELVGNPAVYITFMMA